MSPSRSNPAPRSALRKAPDADVHPATTVPRSASGAVVATPSVRRRKPAAAKTSEPIVESAPADGSSARSPRESTPKTPAPKADPKLTHRQAARVTPPASTKSVAASTSVKSSAKRKFGGSTSDAIRSAAEIPKGKKITVEIVITKRLRKDATNQAKARGMSLDAVVSGLLVGWLDQD
jgi:hypothetical protein